MWTMGYNHFLYMGCIPQPLLNANLAALWVLGASEVVMWTTGYDRFLYMGCVPPASLTRIVGCVGSEGSLRWLREPWKMIDGSKSGCPSTSAT